MAKKRKTRQQKILADLRHNFTHSPAEVSLKETKISFQSPSIPAIIKESKSNSSINVYPYLVKDLSKTGILTSAILAFQVVLYFLLINHFIKFPGLSY